jgi:hypothetical protein
VIEKLLRQRYTTMPTKISRFPQPMLNHRRQHRLYVFWNYMVSIINQRSTKCAA